MCRSSKRAKRESIELETLNHRQAAIGITLEILPKRCERSTSIGKARDTPRWGLRQPAFTR